MGQGSSKGNAEIADPKLYVKLISTADEDEDQSLETDNISLSKEKLNGEDSENEIANISELFERAEFHRGSVNKKETSMISRVFGKSKSGSVVPSASNNTGLEDVEDRISFERAMDMKIARAQAIREDGMKKKKERWSFFRKWFSKKSSNKA